MSASRPVSAPRPWHRVHAPTDRDRAAVAALRAQVGPNKGKLQGVAARPAFDAIAGRVVAPEGVAFREETVGGVRGWWCVPERAAVDAVVLHLHGGWFTWGSAHAFRHLVGHIARGASAPAFVPDYRLAPEHPFPAGLDDARAVYRALAAEDGRRVGVTGDSAGGNLALLVAQTAEPKPVAVAVLSPVTDLALAGESWRSRAEADPYFTAPQARALVDAYLAGCDPANPAASPFHGDTGALPPTRIHVGDDEVLLSDATRFAEKARASGAEAEIDIWEGMPHGFASGVGRLDAADAAMEALGGFLAARLGTR